MKRLLAMLILYACASGQEAPAPTKFQGHTIGETVAQFEAIEGAHVPLECDKKKRRVHGELMLVCSKTQKYVVSFNIIKDIKCAHFYPEEWRPCPGELDYLFQNGVLTEIKMETTFEGFVAVVNILKTNFGEATSTGKEHFQNAFGAQVETISAEWGDKARLFQAPIGGVGLANVFTFVLIPARGAD